MYSPPPPPPSILVFTHFTLYKTIDACTGKCFILHLHLVITLSARPTRFVMVSLSRWRNVIDCLNRAPLRITVLPEMIKSCAIVTFSLLHMILVWIKIIQVLSLLSCFLFVYTIASGCLIVHINHSDDRHDRIIFVEEMIYFHVAVEEKCHGASRINFC